MTNDNKEKPVKPNCDEQFLEAALVFLDELRESGATNMFFIGDYMREWWEEEAHNPPDYSKKLERDIHVYWMKTFSERHPRDH